MIRRFSTVAILALAGLSGCGGSEEDSYTLVRVTGLITKNGEPLADAAVTFTPAWENKVSTPGTDRSGPAGTYMVKFKGRNGVSPGKYKVFVTPAVEQPAGAGITEAFKDDPAAVRLLELSRDRVKGKRGTARSKATAVVSGEFDATVEPGGSQVLDFDVKASSSAKAATASN